MANHVELVGIITFEGHSIIMSTAKIPTEIPHLVPFLVGLLCLALQLVGLEEAVRFDRASVAEGHVWLLMTGNFVHLGWSHFVMNMLGLGLIYWVVWDSYRDIEWVLLLFLSALGVGLGLYFFSPEIHWYVGFSGILHGLILAGALGGLKRYPKTHMMLLVVTIAKLAWEQRYGPVPGSESNVGGKVAVDSHLYGGVVGLVAAGGIYFFKRYRAR